MARDGKFRVVLASDGSAGARSAEATAVRFPWPEPSRATGVMARPRRGALLEWSRPVSAAIDEGVARAASSTRRALRRRWPDADVKVLDKAPVEAILAEARGADAIVIGSRGHGLAGRLLLGSVSRGVVRRARCPTLVVKGQRLRYARFIVGVDGSPNATRAAALVATLPPPRGAHVGLVAVVEPIHPGPMPLMPAGVRAALAREATAMNAGRVRAARRALEAAARGLTRAGWRVTTTVRTGVPLTELLAAATSMRADVIVAGTRGVGGIERLLLGSVAEGLLTQARVPVLLVH